MKVFAAKWLLYFLMSHPQAVAPINAIAVATGCDNVTIQCTYLDTNVSPGPHFYFAVASSSSSFSSPSNRVDVTVPSGTHNVSLAWTPSPSPGVGYFIYRGAPPTNLKITGAQ